MRKIIEAKTKSKKMDIDYSSVCRKYGFSTPKSGKKMSINDGVINISFTEKPFSYFISVLGGYQKDVDNMEKIKGSIEKAGSILKDINDLINDK